MVDAVPVIISDDTFQEVQKVMEQRARRKAKEQ